MYFCIMRRFCPLFHISNERPELMLCSRAASQNYYKEAHYCRYVCKSYYVFPHDDPSLAEICSSH